MAWRLDFSLPGDFQRVINLIAEISDGTFQLRMPMNSGKLTPDSRVLCY